jgi:hypothetical protein
MERVEGTSLRAWLAERPWSQVVKAFVRVADALAAAHRLGLVHGAFNPDAVLVDAEGSPRVVGFTLDRRTDVTDAGRSAGTLAARAQARASGVSGPVLPEEGDVLYTEPSLGFSMTGSSVSDSSAYVPPEQLRGRPAGPAGDQFAFCVSLYELLHGERPFGGDLMAVFVQSVTEAKRPAASRRVELPEPLREILLRGLAADPEERWPSMEALRAELQRVTKPRQRRRRIVGLAVMAGLAGVAGGLTWLSRLVDPAEPPEHAAVAEVEDLHERLAEDVVSLVELAEGALARGDLAAAREHAELAVAIGETVASGSAELAAARFVLAQALWSEPAQRARARALAEQARADHAARGGDGLAEIDAWLATRQ